MRSGALALLTLAACASKPVIWERPGATERDFRMEQAQCRVEVAKVPMESGGGLAGAMSNIAIRSATFDNCMIGRGWEKRPSS